MMDVVLPKLGGPQAYACFCETRPHVPAIFATGYGADIKLLRQARQQGLPILQEPYAPRDLARKVRETLDQHLLIAAK